MLLAFVFISIYMEQTNEIHNNPPFDEEAWIRLIFLLSDTQDWLTETPIP